ncbi:AAA family ATPase [Polyangium spumosum]|uniref:AAA family ATPase n=1 Tax=Polyangium spumosum TaxID=889282 RepID=A0A6N7PKT9_9BACT|nr:AAA family ATPase [Polyangium spumosum]MRG92772.1 AAA family ATPase [Polyangium spumosum]
MLREDLSSVRGGDRIRRMEECIRGALPGDYQVQLLSGHPGSGKSSELHWLAGELKKNKDDVEYHPLVIDVQDYLNARDVQLPEFITAIFTAVLDDPLLGKLVSTTATAKKIWKDLTAWFKEIGITLEAEVPIGTAKMKLGVLRSPSVPERFRAVSHKHIMSLVEGLNELLQALRPPLANHGTDDVVIIADNLERVERLPLQDGTKRTTHDLFFLEQLPIIQEVAVHLIVTVPVSLHFTQGRLRQAFRSPGDVVLPMIAIRNRGTDQPNEAGVAALERLLARRIDCAVVFADEGARRHAIAESGGCLRDLLKIVAQAALMKPELRLTKDDVDAAVKEYVGGMERFLQGKGYLRSLHHVVRTGSFPENFDDDLRQLLLHELIVLEYNGDTWFDVHPFAKRTRAFRDAGT